MNDDGRTRLTALVTASAKLDVAARLVQEAMAAVKSTGLLSPLALGNAAGEIEVLSQRVDRMIGLVK